MRRMFGGKRSLVVTLEAQAVLCFAEARHISAEAFISYLMNEGSYLVP